jgi:hypothetical protein
MIMKNIDNIRHNLRNIGYLYNNYIYKHCPDCFTVKYLSDIPLKKLTKKLNDYFIDMDWNTKETWDKFDLVGKDTLLRSLGCFEKISKITIDEEYRLISFEYPFLVTKQKLYDAYQLIKNDKIEQYKSDCPEMTEAALFWECDRLMVLLMHLETMLDIKVE